MSRDVKFMFKVVAMALFAMLASMLSVEYGFASLTWHRYTIWTLLFVYFVAWFLMLVFVFGKIDDIKYNIRENKRNKAIVERDYERLKEARKKVDSSLSWVQCNSIAETNILLEDAQMMVERLKIDIKRANEAIKRNQAEIETYKEQIERIENIGRLHNK